MKRESKKAVIISLRKVLARNASDLEHYRVTIHDQSDRVRRLTYEVQLTDQQFNDEHLRRTIYEVGLRQILRDRKLDNKQVLSHIRKLLDESRTLHA